MTVTHQLSQLDRLDSDIARLEAELADVRRRARQNAELARAEARAGSARQEAQHVSAALRAAERDIEEVESKMKRDRDRLYSGQVVDPRNIASLEKEIEHYETVRDEREELALDMMERLEAAQRELAGAEAAVIELRARWERERPQLAEREVQIQEEIAARRDEREAVAAAIETRALDMYTRVRKVAGQAVSPLQGSVCGACRVALPPKDVQHVRAGALVTCSNCSRILSPEPVGRPAG
jgi:predicted  nucleic acid-binding Zn-ribbon protein